MTQYLKPPLSIQEQLTQLEQRGLAIGNAVNAGRYLQRVGYYRLMGYLYTQRVAGSDNFREQATFEEAVSLYEFDRGLRDLVMEAVGHIEVATRTVLTYHFAHAYGPFGHLEARNLTFSGTDYAEWLEGVLKEVTRSKETTADLNGWRKRVDAHLTGGLTNEARVKSLGAAAGWQEHRLWRG